MANAMDKLLPCPFCGKAPRSRWYGADVPGAEDGGYWGVDCCMAHSHADSEAEAVAAWNRRATSEAQGGAGATPQRGISEEERQVLDECSDAVARILARYVARKAVEQFATEFFGDAANQQENGDGP